MRRPAAAVEKGLRMTPFESLMADFSRMTGLGLELDERAGCVLETDGIFITVQYRAEFDDVVAFAPVTDPGAAARPSKAMLERALSLAYDGRGTCGASLRLFDGELRKAMDSMEARVDINSEEAVDIRFYLGDEAREHPVPNDRNHSSTVSSL